MQTIIKTPVLLTILIAAGLVLVGVMIGLQVRSAEASHSDSAARFNTNSPDISIRQHNDGESWIVVAADPDGIAIVDYSYCYSDTNNRAAVNYTDLPNWGSATHFPEGFDHEPEHSGRGRYINNYSPGDIQDRVLATSVRLVLPPVGDVNDPDNDLAPCIFAADRWGNHTTF